MSKIKRVTIFLLLFFLCFNVVDAAKVDITTYVYRDFTIFNYVFQFDNNDSFNKFSVQKPEDAKLSYIVDKNGVVESDIAGDYYIFKSKNLDNNTYLLKYTSDQLSRDIFTTDSFQTYVAFDFDVDVLTFKLILKEDFGEIVSVFPEGYELKLGDQFVWTSYNVTKDSLYVVNFKDASHPTTSYYNYYLYGLLFVLVVALLVVLVVIYKKYSSLKRKEEKRLEKLEEKQDSISNLNQEKILDSSGQEVETNVESFDDIVNKHLTDNEKEVVLLIREHEGISQYDILNYLPKLTKSNLSKIVSKLHSRKILKRIKVGKVNNIYLGEVLSKKDK